MRVAVYAIAKNESKHVERWAMSAQDADHVILLDTGSTDNTVALAEALGVTVHTQTFDPWRFDTARNASLKLVPEDVDYCIALDLDEILVDGWRDALEKAHAEGWTRPRYQYTWSWNPDGSPGLVYGGDKIHARHGYVWKHPVHEVITPLGAETQGWVGLQIEHHPDHTKSRSQYLPLLALSVQEDPNDDRNAYYYARELMFSRQNEDSVREFKRYLSLPTAKWDAERSKAMRFLAKLEPARAEHWLLRATAEAPHRREPWVDLSEHYYNRKLWPLSLGAALRALDVKEKPLEYLCEAEAWGAKPYDLAAIASYWIGDKRTATVMGEKAAQLAPNDGRLQENLKHYTSP
jgi:glycosyltransferase involved in cell wall biosynthesis